MSKQKKHYVKPEMTIIPAGSSRYNEIKALLKAEDAKAKEQKNIPSPAESK